MKITQEQVALLPDKLSDLMQMGLDDVIKCEKSKKYEIDMRFWHLPDEDLDEPVCAVCCVGAIMAKTMKVPADKHAHYWDVPWEGGGRPKISMLSGLAAQGWVGDYMAQHVVGCEKFTYREFQPILETYVAYAVDRLKWRKYMRAVIKYLKSCDL